MKPDSAVALPVHLAWSGLTTFDLDQPRLETPVEHAASVRSKARSPDRVRRATLP